MLVLHRAERSTTARRCAHDARGCPRADVRELLCRAGRLSRIHRRSKARCEWIVIVCCHSCRSRGCHATGCGSAWTSPHHWRGDRVGAPARAALLSALVSAGASCIRPADWRSGGANGDRRRRRTKPRRGSRRRRIGAAKHARGCPLMPAAPARPACDRLDAEAGRGGSVRRLDPCGPHGRRRRRPPAHERGRVGGPWHRGLRGVRHHASPQRSQVFRSSIRSRPDKRGRLSAPFGRTSRSSTCSRITCPPPSCGRSARSRR